MANKHADQLKFREWLVKQLKTTRWSKISGESPADLADRLGVTLAVLEEAKQERSEDLRRQGKVSRQLGNRAVYHNEYATLEVTMPPTIYAAWQELCRGLRVEPATLLRSLVHHFLLTKNRPKTTGRTWLYRRAQHRIKPTARHHAKTRITRGAQTALDQYADLWNVTPTGIVRGIVTDALELQQTLRIKLVSVSAMWGDPARYLGV